MSTLLEIWWTFLWRFKTLLYFQVISNFNVRKFFSPTFFTCSAYDMFRQGERVRYCLCKSGVDAWINPPVWVSLTSVTCCSRNLMASLALTSGSHNSHVSGTLESAWQAAASLVNNIRAELLNMTPPRQVTASGTHRPPSPLSSCIQRELETISQQIETISVITDDLVLVLEGQSAATPTAVEALKCVASQQLPLKVITSQSQHRGDLTGWIRDVKQTLARLTAMGTDEDHAVFDLSVFCRSEGFLDAVLRHLARRQFKGLHSLHLTGSTVRTTICCFFQFPLQMLMMAGIICKLPQQPSPCFTQISSKQNWS